MSVRSRLAKRAEKLDYRAAKLRLKPTPRRELKAKRLEGQAADNWEMLENWDADRYGT